MTSVIRAPNATVNDVIVRISRTIVIVQRALQNGDPDERQSRRLLTSLYDARRNLQRLHNSIDQSEFNSKIQTIDHLVSYLRGLVTPIEADSGNTCEGSNGRLARIRKEIVGPPKCNIVKEKLEHLLSLGFTVRQIARDGLLGGTVHYNTIHNFIKKNGMLSPRDHYTTISDSLLEDRVKEINQNFPNSGANEVLAHLRNEGVIIQRDRVRTTLATIDPVGMARRWSSTIQRRSYSVPTPNFLWHVDSHHKIIRWNFVVHGSIDGFSRLIPFMRVCTNNLAKTALEFFVEGIRKYGIPSRVRADKGSEFNQVNTFMNEVNGENRGSFIQGKSVHNQRIERLWRDVHEKVVFKYKGVFQHMEEHNILNIDNPVQMFCLHHVFSKRIDRDLINWTNAHNNHTIRTEHCKTPVQLWFAAGIRSANCDSTAMNNLHRTNLQEVERFIVEFTDRVFVEPDDIGIVLQRFPCPLTLNQKLQLDRDFDVLAESSSHGVDIYIGVLRYVRDCISS